MMNRRQFLAQVPAGAVGLSAATRLASAAVVRDGRPNVLFMIADDLTFRALNSSMKRQVKTPNLDKLARSGCTFTHCFQQGGWTGAICVPSRTMLNTGLTTFNARKAIPENQSFEHATWGQTFRAAGYETFITGKWHLDAVSLNRSFEHQVCVGPGYLPSTPDMYNRPAAGNHWSPADTSLAGHWLHTELWRNKRPGTVEHSSSVYADSAIEFLRTRSAKSARPFFMYVGFNAPHDPRQAPQQYLDMYPMESIELPPNYVPQHPFDQGMARDRDEMLAPFPRTEEAVRVHRQEYYAIISHMDAEVGRILAALEATGEAENTYVIFTADHGLAVGEHGLMGKQNQYECSMHMPLLMRGPGIAAGKRVDHLVYQHCMYATTCDLAGIGVPQHVEFQSLAPMLHKDRAEPIYDSVFGWITNIQRSVRTTRYRMIFYPQLNRYQLFDLEDDPWELKDLAGNPEFAATLDDMRSRLKKQQLALGDTLETKA
jgi:arylsulfatase A-like enzyme